jgi:hypothetical protein
MVRMPLLLVEQGRADSGSTLFVVYFTVSFKESIKMHKFDLSGLDRAAWCDSHMK